MRIEDWNVIHDMVIASTCELLDSIALPSTYRGAVPHRSATWAECLSIIGLTGNLRGSLILSIPAALLVASHPTNGTSSDEANDWLAELANLLLGRLKAKLLVHGVVIELSTPLTISATAFRFERFSGAPVVYEFASADETFHVVFAAIGDEELQLGPYRAAAAVPVGELIRF